MFKKRFLTIGITLFAFIAVIGAGFASWVFSSQRRVDFKPSIVITHANTFGDFTSGLSVHDGYYLVLDQSGIKLHADRSDEGIDVLTETWKVSYASYQDTLPDTVKANESTPSDSYIEYYIYIYLNADTLGQYLTFDETKLEQTDDILGGTGDHNHSGFVAYRMKLTPTTDVYDETNPATGAYVNLPEEEGADITVDFALTMDDLGLTWKEGKEPTSWQQYQDMVRTILGEEGMAVDAGTEYTTENDFIIEFCVYNNTPADNS